MKEKHLEIVKFVRSIELGVCREDGVISREQWKRLASDISTVFMKVAQVNSLYKERVSRVGDE